MVKLQIKLLILLLLNFVDDMGNFFRWDGFPMAIPPRRAALTER